MTPRRGLDVTIYQDPVTRTKPEGTARLIRNAELSEGDLCYWFVRFPGDDASFPRWIHPDDVTCPQA